MCLRGFYNNKKCMGWIFIIVMVVLHSIFFLSSYKRIMEGGKDVIFIFALCR